MFHLLIMLSIFLLGVPAPAAVAGTFTGAPCWVQDAASIGDHVWLLCERDQVFRSRDQGATWQASPLPSDRKLRAITFLDERKGFAVGDQGTLMSSEDGGASWIPVSLHTSEDLWDIQFVEGNGWIAGYGGTVLHSSDGGKSWNAQLTGTSLSLENIFFLDKDHGWAVGWNGIILRTINGGQFWEDVQPPAAKWSLSCVYFTDRNHGWAAGFMGQLLRTRDGGQSWEAEPVPVRETLTSVLFEKSGRGWITAGNDLLVSEDGGGTWQTIAFDRWYLLKKLIPVKDSLWAVGPIGILKKGGTEKTWRKLEVFSDAS